MQDPVNLTPIIKKSLETHQQNLSSAQHEYKILMSELDGEDLSKLPIDVLQNYHQKLMNLQQKFNEIADIINIKKIPDFPVGYVATVDQIFAAATKKLSLVKRLILQINSNLDKEILEKKTKNQPPSEPVITSPIPVTPLPYSSSSSSSSSESYLKPPIYSTYSTTTFSLNKGPLLPSLISPKEKKYPVSTLTLESAEIELHQIASSHDAKQIRLSCSQADTADLTVLNTMELQLQRDQFRIEYSVLFTVIDRLEKIYLQLTQQESALEFKDRGQLEILLKKITEQIQEIDAILVKIPDLIQKFELGIRQFQGLIITSTEKKLDKTIPGDLARGSSGSLPVLSQPASQLQLTLQCTLAQAIALKGGQDSAYKIAIGQCGSNAEQIFFTSDLASCQGVVARSARGDLTLYHASSPHASAHGFKLFVQHIRAQEDVDEIFVLQKSADIHKSNFDKASVLAIELSNALEINVRVVAIKSYNAIVCDPKNNSIIVAEMVFLIPGQSQNFLSIARITNPRDISDNFKNAAGLEKNTATLQELQSKGSYTKIPIPDEKKWQVKKRLSQALASGKKEEAQQLIQGWPAADRVALLTHPLFSHLVIINNFLAFGLAADFSNSTIQKLYQYAEKLPEDILNLYVKYLEYRPNILIDLIIEYNQTKRNYSKFIASIIKAPKFNTLSHNQIILLGQLSEEFADEFSKSNKAKKIAKKINEIHKISQFVDALSEDFAILLLEENRLQLLPKEQITDLAFNYEDLAIALALRRDCRELIDILDWLKLTKKFPYLIEIVLSTNWLLFDLLDRQTLLAFIKKRTATKPTSERANYTRRY